MELAIIGGLAALGMLNYERKHHPLEEPVPDEYRMPEDARFIYDPKNAGGMNSMENPRVTMYLAPNSYQQPNTANFEYAQQLERDRVNAMSMNAVPLRSDRRAAGVDIVRGAVAPVGPVRLNNDFPTAPFYRSQKSQFHSDANSRMRIESFTGGDSLNMRRAHEPAGTMFAPQPNVNTGRDMLCVREAELEHIPVGTFKNNEAPIGRQTVGPGLGLSPGEAPSGGFHPYFRILPDNVGQYRNNLPGGLIVGGQPVTEGPRRFGTVPSH